MAASTRGWSLDFLISKAPDTLRHADRVSAKLPLADLNAKIREHEQTGRPLVIQGFHDLDHWPKDELNLDRFVERSAEDTVSVRNVHTWTDSTVKLTEFVEKSRSMGPYVQENETERWYGKDMECPKAWEEWLRTGGVVPTMLLGNGSHDLFRYRPKSAPVQTLMCYLGIGDTFTPCHKDLCASSGQNLMCYTENNGSSFWFMTASSAAPKASKYFQDLFHELDHENHVVTIEELAKAPFEVYVLEQKLGDLVLVPPRSCHQVVNSGGITVKTSWSRMTLKGLITAYYHEIPIYRRVCRPEIYKVKSTIFHTIIGQTQQLSKLKSKKAYLTPPSSAGTSRLTDRNLNQENSAEALANSLKELIPVADAILSEEYDKMGETMPKTYNGRNRFRDESSLTCDFCGCDIFQSFFECVACVEGGISSADRLHICPGCYVDGRTCTCSKLQPQQYGNFQELIDVRENAVKVVRSYERTRGETFTAELRLKNEQLPQLFRAACRLYTDRLQSTLKERVCTLTQKHSMLNDEGLNCKGCHHSRCFRHMLESHKVYVADALLVHASDKTPQHTKYHANHQSKSAAFKNGLLALENNQAHGTRHTGYSQLVFNALNYSNCEPVRHAQYLKGGWYDNYEFMDKEEGQDESTSATTSRDTTPLITQRPSLKITLPAKKPNPPTVISSLSTTTLTSLPSTSGNDLDTTDIPMTPKSDVSYDSDDLPLTHPSFLAHISPRPKEPSIRDDPHKDPTLSGDYAAPLSPLPSCHSDSESEDMRTIDAVLIPAPSTETSPSKETEREVVGYKKKMDPYVLVPRLTEQEKMKYVFPRLSGEGTPYVSVPPAHYSIEPSKYQDTSSSKVPTSHVQRRGVRVLRIESASPEAVTTGEFKDGFPAKKKKASAVIMNTTLSSSVVPKKRKSDVLSTTTTATTETTTSTPTKTSPPRPKKSPVFVKFVRQKSGRTSIVRQQSKKTDPAQDQSQPPPAKKVAVAGSSGTPDTPPLLASIKTRRESLRKMPRISKAPSSSGSSGADAQGQGPPAASTSGPSSSSFQMPSEPKSNAVDPIDLLQQVQDSVLQQAQVTAEASSSSLPNRGDIRQVAIRAIKEILSIANGSTSQSLNDELEQQDNLSGVTPLSVPEMSAILPGMHPTQSPPTQPIRMTRSQQQRALGQYPQSGPSAPWRGGVGEQYGPPGPHRRSGYGRYSDVRPYQNQNSGHTGNQRQPRVMHPYFNHQRRRNTQFGFQQGMGWPGGSNPSSSSRPNFHDYGQYPPQPQQFPAFDPVRSHPQAPGSLGNREGSGSVSAHFYMTYEASATAGAGERDRDRAEAVTSPLREPRRPLFQSDRDRDGGKGKGKAKSKGKMSEPEEWERNDEMEMETRIWTSSSVNGNANANANWKGKSKSLLERLEPGLPFSGRGSERGYDDAPGPGPSSCSGPGPTQQSSSRSHGHGFEQRTPSPSRSIPSGPDTSPSHRKRPSRFGPPLHYNGSYCPSDSLDQPRRSRPMRTSQEGQEGDDEAQDTLALFTPSRSRSWETRIMEEETGGRVEGKGGDDRIVLRSRTPMLGAVTLVDEVSAPAFPETDFESLPRNETDGTEEEKEESALERAPLTQQEEDGCALPFEEEEEDSLKPFEEQEEEESLRFFEEEEEEDDPRPPSLVQVQSIIFPNPDEDTSQMWEDNYELEEENEFVGVSPPKSRSAVAVVPESDDEYEVSLGEEDDCGGPVMMDLGC